MEIWFGRFSVLERMIKGSTDVWSGMAMVSPMKNRINVVCLLYCVKRCKSLRKLKLQNRYS